MTLLEQQETGSAEVQREVQPSVIQESDPEMPCGLHRPWVYALCAKSR